MTTTPHQPAYSDDLYGRMPVEFSRRYVAPGAPAGAAPTTPVAMAGWPAPAPVGTTPMTPMTPTAPPAPGRVPTEPLAVAALVSAFVVPIVGVVLGVVARRRTTVRGTGGRGLALAGIVLGAVFSAMWVVTLVAVLALGGTVSAAVSTTPSVPAASVESSIVTRAELAPGSVSCPEDLPATVGAGIACTATMADGTVLPIDVRVSSVQGDDVEFDFSSR